MKPVQFKQSNKVYAKDQKPYRPLPVYEDGEQGGRVFHCWKLTWIERIKILFFGKLWISVLNFGQKLQPILPMVDNPWEQPPH